jgi:hypothetical protein
MFVSICTLAVIFIWNDHCRFLIAVSLPVLGYATLAQHLHCNDVVGGGEGALSSSIADSEKASCSVAPRPTLATVDF